MRMRTFAVGALLVACFAPAAEGQLATTFDLDTVQVGRFDYGKMWPFEYAPTEYFSETYGFEADEAWFERARLSALRIPGCSAAFVSPHGLVVTNHHCVRDAVGDVALPGERLLDDGFFAGTVAQERRIPDFYADQLIAVDDVSDRVFAALDGAGSDSERAQARERATTAIIAEARAQYGAVADSLYVQVVDLYGGGRYSVYVFRRFTDVRMVFAVELEMGFFGGDPDNFTYPRYALDFAFLRIYEDGQPYRPEHHFGWGADGVEEGDAVFVIGNPGETNRLATMEQIRLQAEVTVPASIAWFTSTHRALGDFYDVDRERAEAMGVRDMMFSLSNSLKAYTGRAAALQDPAVVARKAAGERQLIDSIEVRPGLAAEVGGVLAEIAEIQAQKRTHAPAYAAFLSVANPSYTAATIRRAFSGYTYVASRQGDAPQNTLLEMRRRLVQIGDLPDPLERSLLVNRLTDFVRYLPADHPAARLVTGFGSLDAAASALLASPLGRAASTAAAVEAGTLSLEDPVVRLGAAILPAYAEFADAWNGLSAREADLTVELGRARFDIFGESIPPDGTFSPRITDGVVRGYEYNGTVAPPYTTFFGVYDRAIGHRGAVDWSLPPRWETPPAGLGLATPLNFISTADTYGGNSGSPAVTRDLDLVGLNFDRNINGLSRDYIYLPEQGRNVMVDVRAIDAALAHAYGAQRILTELTTGSLPTAP
jgi:hypothetical protein